MIVMKMAQMMIVTMEARKMIETTNALVMWMVAMKHSQMHPSVMKCDHVMMTWAHVLILILSPDVDVFVSSFAGRCLMN